MTVAKRITTISEYVENSEKSTVDLEEALAVAGIGWYNAKYCLVLALFLIAAIVEPVGYSYVLPAAKCDLHMTDTQRGFIASVPYIGIIITSYPWGYMVDMQGRKRTAIYSSMGAGIFGILAAFMPEIISFAICKFISALCIAGSAAVPYSFIGEIVPQKNRDITMSMVNAMQILGSALVPLLAWGILPLNFRLNFGLYDFRPWRLLVIANAALFVIAAQLLAFGPESPKYLVAQGKHDEALKVLQNIYAGNKGKSPDDFPVKALNMPKSSQLENRSILTSLKEQTVPLMMPPFLKWMALEGFLLFGIFATLNGLYVWVPDILNRVISGTRMDMTACQVIAQRLNQTAPTECNDVIEMSTFFINSIANSACAVLAIVGSSTVKIIGKKALLVIVFFMIGIFCFLINFITDPMAFAAMLSALPIMGLAIGCVNSFAVEIFPPHLRGMAIGLAMMIGRLGSVVGANVAGLLINIVCEAAFYLFGSLHILCGLLTFLLPTYQPPPEQIALSTRL